MPRQMRSLLPLFLLLASMQSPAQDAFSVSPEDIARARQKQVMPTDEQIKKAMAQSNDAFRRIDPQYQGLDKIPLIQQAVPNVPVQKEGSGIDINTLVEQYSKVQQAPNAKPKGNDLMIFVSLAMPAESLERLTQQAERAGAVLVLRGLKNDSLKDTTAEIYKYERKHKAAWQINPPAFKKFDVSVVPTFVLAKASQAIDAMADGCAPAGSFVAVSGDVTLDYALEAIGKNRTDFTREANGFLDKIRGR